MPVATVELMAESVVQFVGDVAVSACLGTAVQLAPVAE